MISSRKRIPIVVQAHHILGGVDIFLVSVDWRWRRFSVIDIKIRKDWERWPCSFQLVQQTLLVGGIESFKVRWVHRPFALRQITSHHSSLRHAWVDNTTTRNYGGSFMEKRMLLEAFSLGNPRSASGHEQPAQKALLPGHPVRWLRRVNAKRT